MNHEGYSLQDVPGTGKKNQVLNASDGFARNYLLPRKWAVEASEGSVKEIERRSSALRQKELDGRNAAEALAHSLKGKVITLRAKCGDKGRLWQRNRTGDRPGAQGAARR